MSVVRHLRADPAEAAHYLAFLLGWGGGKVPVFRDGQQTPVFSVEADGEGLWRRAHRLDMEHDAQVELGLPLEHRFAGASTVLWAWVGAQSLSAAHRFRPHPSMVLRFGGGSERLMLWALTDPIGWPSIKPHNERLAYALRAPRTRCDAEKLRVPLPGTFLRCGRARPVPVLVTRMDDSLDTFSLGRLKDPPSRDAWKQRGRV